MQYQKSSLFAQHFSFTWCCLQWCIFFLQHNHWTVVLNITHTETQKLYLFLLQHVLDTECIPEITSFLSPDATMIILRGGGINKKELPPPFAAKRTDSSYGNVTRRGATPYMCHLPDSPINNPVQQHPGSLFYQDIPSRSYRSGRKTNRQLNKITAMITKWNHFKAAFERLLP